MALSRNNNIWPIHPDYPIVSMTAPLPLGEGETLPAFLRMRTARLVTGAENPERVPSFSPGLADGIGLPWVTVVK